MSSTFPRRRSLAVIAALILLAAASGCGGVPPLPERPCGCPSPGLPDRVVIFKGNDCAPFLDDPRQVHALLCALAARVYSIGQTPANEMPPRVFAEGAGAGRIVGMMLVYERPLSFAWCGHGLRGRAPSPAASGEGAVAWPTRPVNRIFIPLAPGPDQADPFLIVGNVWVTGPDYRMDPVTGPDWDLASLELDDETMALYRRLARLAGVRLEP